MCGDVSAERETGVSSFSHIGTDRFGSGGLITGSAYWSRIKDFVD